MDGKESTEVTSTMVQFPVPSKTQFQRASVNHKGREAKSLSYLVNKTNPPRGKETLQGHSFAIAANKDCVSDPAKPLPNTLEKAREPAHW